jgi:hypothetical protein
VEIRAGDVVELMPWLMMETVICDTDVRERFDICVVRHMYEVRANANPKFTPEIN